MQVLVVGANGLLGSNVVAEGLGRDLAIAGTYHTTDPGFACDLFELDLQDTRQLRQVVTEVTPEVVVNCAAMTDVDRCEQEPEAAHAVNGEAPGDLADACAGIGARLVHVSTDYVFDGRAASPYDESAEPDPIQAYGESKLAGELAVRESDVESLVVRLSFVYGVHAASGELSGFPAWVRDRARRGESTPLFTDQHVTPSRAGGVAGTVFELVRAGTTGTVHVASRSCVTPYEFGRSVLDRLSASNADLEGGSMPIEQGSMTDVDRRAPRPRYTCLDVGRLETTLGRPQPTVEEDLDAIADAIRG